jgi:predicted NBD/HSP70 family sugar kinase
MTTLRRRRNAGAAEGDERLAEEMMQDLLEDFEDPTPSVRSVGVTAPGEGGAQRAEAVAQGEGQQMPTG